MFTLRPIGLAGPGLVQVAADVDYFDSRARCVAMSTEERPWNVVVFCLHHLMTGSRPSQSAVASPSCAHRHPASGRSRCTAPAFQLHNSSRLGLSFAVISGSTVYLAFSERIGLSIAEAWQEQAKSCGGWLRRAMSGPGRANLAWCESGPWRSTCGQGF